MTQTNTPQHIRLDERNHVEKPLLNQLAGIGWEIADLNSIPVIPIAKPLPRW